MLRLLLRRSVDYRFSLLNIRLAFTTPNSTTPSSTTFDWTAIHHDGQGSVRGVTNSAGAKAERTLYRPYGNW